MFHHDMTCLCNKNPLGFQCHISQQLVGNNVCPNCCSKSPTTASEKKKKKNYYSTLKLPQLLNFVYFKVEEKKEFKNWSIANPNSTAAPVAPMICRLCKFSLHMRALHLLPPRSFHDLSELVQQGLPPGDAAIGGWPHYLIMPLCP